MPVCHKHRLAFCHIPRTGGVSVCNGLELEIVDKHFPASWYRKNFPNYTLFTIVRPYEERIKSALGWKIPENRKHEADTFPLLVELIKQRGFDNSGLMVKPNEYFLDCDVDFVIRYEHLQNDLDKMLEQLGLKKVKLIRCNSFR